jgi:hypothetical protein
VAVAAPKVAVVAITLASLVACSSGADDRSPGADAGSNSSRASSPSTAEDLVSAIGCSDERRREVDPGEPSEPTIAIDCTLGEAQIGIQTYATADDRDAVMAYLAQFAGFRVVGERWIIAVDTREAAATVSDLTGGENVTLEGTQS